MSTVDQLKAVINTIGVQQDVQYAQALNQLQNMATTAGSNRLDDYLMANRLIVTQLVGKEHSDTMKQVYDQFQRADANTNSLLYYGSRNKDLAHVQGSITERARAEAIGSEHDSQLARRQFEIQEWSAANKAESIFLMQLFLAAVCITIFLLVLNRFGLLPTSVFIVISSLLFIAVALTIVIRAQYTNYTRNGRYWNRRNFGRVPAPDVSGICPPVPQDSVTSQLSPVANAVAADVTDFGRRGVSALQSIGSGIASGLSGAGAAFNQQ